MSGIRLPSKTFIFGTTVLAVVIIIGGLSWTLVNSNQPTQNSSSLPESQNPEVPPATSPGSSDNPSNATNSDSSGTSFPETAALPEEVKDAAIAYIKTTYPKVAQFMTDLAWTGGRLETGDVSTETYIYYASDWTVTVEWLLVSNPTYKVSANYTSAETLIVWQGTYQNGNVKETSYTFNP